MKRILLLFATLIALTSHAQDTVYNTISGTIWRDDNIDGLRDAGEPAVPGILVNLVDAATDSVLSVAISDTTGVFVLPNYKGNGSFYLDYYYPTDGFVVTNHRIGADLSLNSAAGLASPSGNINATASDTFTISASTNLDNSYGLGLVRLINTITFWNAEPSTATNWVDTFQFPKSYDGTGILIKATIFTTDAAEHPIMGIENTGPSIEPAELDVSGRITLELPVGADLITNTNAVRITTLDSFDGTIDYMGTSGMTWYNNFSSDVSTRTITQSTQLANFRTTTLNDSFSINASTTGAATVIGSGNLFANVSTNVGAGVFVTYTYSTALPVSLLSFAAIKKDKEAMLSWAAVSSEDISGFTIERSTDGINFTQTGFAAAAPGNEGKISNYSFTDEHPAAGMNFYRLSMNENGQTRYSNIASLNFSENGHVSVYPNPAATTVNVITSGSSEIRLYNQMGQLISVPLTQHGGEAVLDISGLQAGVYHLEVTEGGVSATQSLVVQ